MRNAINSVIVGLGFGDEGKGLFVDYLCSKDPLNTAVVRFSGGHQVSHTVETDDIHHVFSNFGSGTLRGCWTIWSSFCTFDPVGFINEWDILREKGISPNVMIENSCQVVTPFDIAHNQKTEIKLQHGSCGVGFGSTVNRSEKGYSLTFLDLFYPEILSEKVRLIKRYYSEYYSLNEEVDLSVFFDCCSEVSKYISEQIQPDITTFQNLIFEGSQGLLLDQKFGFFPNVTRSNTGSHNLHNMINLDDANIFLVTRAYQTRHGNGFMTNEDIPHNIKNNPEETNVANEYQGKFRRSLLDVSLLEYAIKKDKSVYNSKNCSLVITCLDHVEDEYRFTYNQEIISSSTETEFVFKIMDILKIGEAYLSKSPNSRNIEHFHKKGENNVD